MRRNWAVCGLFVIEFFMIVAAAQADEFTGLSGDASRSGRFPCDKYLSIVKQSPRPAMSFQWGTSWGPDDTDYVCPKRFLTEISKPRLLEIHFSYEAGRRHGALAAGDFFPGDNIKAYNKRLETMTAATRQAITDQVDLIYSEFAPLCDGDCQLVLSTGLEDNYTAKAYSNLLSVIKSHWPFLVVRSPGTGTKDTGIANFYEYHAIGKIKAKPCIANEDGILDVNAAFDKKYFVYYKSCYVRFLFRTSLKGIYHNDNTLARSKRKFTITAADAKASAQFLRVTK